MYLRDKFSTPSVIATTMENACEKEDSKRHLQVQKLFRTAYFSVKEDLAFNKFSDICELQKLNGVELGENYINNKSCSNFAISIANDIKQETKNSLNNCRFVTIMSDGSTDKGITS